MEDTNKLLTQLTNNLNELSTDIKSEFKGLNDRLTEIEKLNSGLNEKISGLDKRLSNLETIFNTFEGKLPQISEAFGELKNWRQIAFLVLAAFAGWIIKGGMT